MEVSIGGTTLYVRRWGTEGGRSLLFLHALGPASSAAFLGLAVGPLVDAGFDVAAPDLPGYGGSPALDADAYAVPALATLIADLAASLGWDRLDLVGHSWGGAIACHLAASRPELVRSLVLVDSGHLDYAEVPGVDMDASIDDLAEAAEAARLRIPDREHVAKLIGTDVDDVLVDAFLEGMEADDDGGHLVSRTRGIAGGAARFHLARSRQSETWPVIARQRIPTLLLLATEPEDARKLNEGGAERFAAAMPQAEVRWVEGATHSLVTDERERFGSTLADWLGSGTHGD